MGIFDKLKDAMRMSEEDYLDDINVDDDDVEEDDVVQPRSFVSRRQSSSRQYDTSADNVVNINSSAQSSRSESAKAHVVFLQINSFAEVNQAADVVKDKRVVLLNIETCPNEDSRRILDFIYGVAYACNGEINRIAARAYIITPHNVPFTGELLDEAVTAASNNSLF